MDNIALLILGIFISVIGIVNMTGNISTIHSYNRRKVKEEDVPKYGRAVGTGTLIIGVSLIAAFVTTFWSEKAMSFIVIPALVIGLGFILYAQFKYNKGIYKEYLLAESCKSNTQIDRCGRFACAAFLIADSNGFTVWHFAFPPSY